MVVNRNVAIGALIDTTISRHLFDQHFSKGIGCWVAVKDQILPCQLVGSSTGKTTQFLTAHEDRIQRHCSECYWDKKDLWRHKCQVHLGTSTWDRQHIYEELFCWQLSLWVINCIQIARNGSWVVKMEKSLPTTFNSKCLQHMNSFISWNPTKRKVRWGEGTEWITSWKESFYRTSGATHNVATNWLGINNTVDCIQESQKEHHCSHKRAVMSQATNTTLQTILQNT